MRQTFLWVTIGMLALWMVGCARITTEVVEKPRVDQEIQGNRGFLVGSAPLTAPRKSTRKVIQTDIELPTAEELNPWRARKTPAPFAPAAQATLQPTLPEPVPPLEEAEWEPQRIPAPPVSPKPTAITRTYTVKKGDTLEKIASQEYGDSRKWRRIYEANRNVLANPNRLYPGQKLAIPPLAEKKQEEREEWVSDLK